jgi:hypothetical protein
VQTDEGGSTSSQPLLVWNSASDAALDYTIATSPGWLSCLPATGSTSGNATAHTVRIDPAGLNAGDYAGTITITAAQAVNSPVIVPVMLSVGNVAPAVSIVSIAPNPAQPPFDVVAFQGAASDAAGSITAREWRSDLDGILSDLGGFSRPASELSVGQHTITFTAWDDEGTSAVDQSVLVVEPVPQFTLTTVADPAEAGAVSPAGTTTHDAGNTVTVTAVPECGWRLDRWSGDASGTADSVQVYIDDNKVVTAHFARIEGPDLGGRLDGIAPQEVTGNQDVTLFGEVFNDGTQATAQSFWIEFWARDPATGTPYAFCESILLQGSLAAGESYDLSSSGPRTCFGGIPEGVYVIEMRIDATNTVVESCEADNTAEWGDATILRGLPNLTIQDFDFEPEDVSPAGGDPIQFTGRVVNDGSQPTSGSWRIEFRVWPAPYFQDSGPLLCESVLISQALAPGESIDLATLPDRVTSSLSPGVYTVGIRVDPDQAIDEQREDDNTTFVSLKYLYVGPRPTRATIWRLYR